jgi:hypothetical protein
MVCFAQSMSISSTPARFRNGAYFGAYFNVAHWPARKVWGEISIIMGYTFKQNSEAVVEIGSKTFRMLTRDDGAWVRDIGTDPAVVQAMGSSSELLVRGTSSGGIQTVDRYSLDGFAEALESATKRCSGPLSEHLGDPVAPDPFAATA